MNFDDELEEEVRRVMTGPGEEGRRAMAVRDLHSDGAGLIAVRVAAVALGVAFATGLFYLVGGQLLLRALTDLCTAVGVCG
jgi:hypothetical protein